MSLPISKLLCIATLLGPTVAFAEDIVIVRGKPPPQEQVPKRGEIVDWTGGQLRLRGALGREELIPSDRILEVQSTWPESQQSAERLRSEGKLDDAIKAYYAAKTEEPRDWAVRRSSADLTVALLEKGEPHLAGDEFLAITAVDPATHLFDAIPLAWRSSSVDGAVITKARSWLGSDATTARLLGASWLLATENRSQAIAALEQLKTASDHRIAAAAEIQLWRTRVVTARPDEIERWKAAADKVPRELRGVAWYQIGEALARQGKAEDAALAYLQTALTYNRQRAMAADALVAAGMQLEKLDRKQQAAGLYREVVADYSTTAAATLAKSKLAALAKQ